MRNIVLAALAVVAASGCGPAALQSATKQKVTTADIVGTWKYFADYGKTTITLEMKRDGRFIQTIKRSKGADQVHKGAWALNESRPELNLLKPVFGEPDKEWVVADANWWIVESNRQGVKFAIVGAADDYDPDSCGEFEKVR
jgi:hypothetical protein